MITIYAEPEQVHQQQELAQMNIALQEVLEILISKVISNRILFVASAQRICIAQQRRS